jgi:PDZ domain-containing protein
MNRRSLATTIALPLMLALVGAAAFLPIPYVTSAPGVTVDVLATTGGAERIEVTGRPSYHDKGELRMTTVSVTNPGRKVRLAEALEAWWNDDESVQPYAELYDEGETDEEHDQQGAIQMVDSQDAAVAAALSDLGVAYDEVPAVVAVTEGAPADGNLEPEDRILAVGGTDVQSVEQVVDAVSAAAPGQPLDLVVERAGQRRTVTVTPEEVDGETRMGVTVGLAFEFPVDVTVRISPQIGGPSAGLVFALGIYDTLTRGSLTGGHDVAGTGTIDPDGRVGPIGGIQQKIAGAREAGSELFLVPAENCNEAVDAHPGDMRLVRVATLREARTAIESWVDDPGADLPACEEGEAG